MERRVIFLEGPIGAGKTTLGRALASRFDGRFLDGDAFSDPARPWFGSILSTSRGILAATLTAAREAPVVVIAYPLRCRDHVWFRGRLAEAGLGAIFVSLRASPEAIVDPARGRAFSAEERARIPEMVAQGYGARPFSDLVISTEEGGIEDVLAELEAGVRRLIAQE